MPHRRGGGGRWTSLHESTSVCPPLLISAPCTDFTPYIYCTLTLHFALSKHTHTSTRLLSCTTHPHKHNNKHYIFFALSTPAAQDHFPPGHRHCQNHCTLYNRVRPFSCIWKHSVWKCSPYVYVYMFSLCVCVCICDLCMHVGEVYMCIRYWMT